MELINNLIKNCELSANNQPIAASFITSYYHLQKKIQQCSLGRLVHLTDMSRPPKSQEKSLSGRVQMLNQNPDYGIALVQIFKF